MAEARRPPDLAVALAPSRVLAAALAAAHLCASALLLIAVSNAGVRVAACALLVANACWTVRRHALLASARSVVGVVLHGESECRLQVRAGPALECRLQGSTHVSTAMIVLHLRRLESRRRDTVIILPDHVGADAFRRLRVRLRWGAIGSNAEAQASASL